LRINKESFKNGTIDSKHTPYVVIKEWVAPVVG